MIWEMESKKSSFKQRSERFLIISTQKYNEILSGERIRQSGPLKWICGAQQQQQVLCEWKKGIKKE